MHSQLLLASLIKAAYTAPYGINQIVDKGLGLVSKGFDKVVDVADNYTYGGVPKAKRTRGPFAQMGANIGRNLFEPGGAFDRASAPLTPVVNAIDKGLNKVVDVADKSGLKNPFAPAP